VQKRAVETRAKKGQRCAEEEEERCCIKTALDNDKEAHGYGREKRCGKEKEDRQSTKERRRSEKVEAKGGYRTEEGGVRGILTMRERERERERGRERKRLREREAFSRPPPRAVVRFGPRGRGEYERPNYENDPV